MPLFYEIGLFYCIPFILLTLLTEVEWFGWATLELLAFAAIMGTWHHDTILPFLKAHVGDVAESAGLYIGLGIGWSYVKWGIFLYHFRSSFRESRRKYLTSRDLAVDLPIPPEAMGDFNRWSSNKYAQRPQATDHKSRIIVWMSLWPCSIIGFVLNDPIRRLFTTVFNMLKSSYQKISNNILDDVEFDKRPVPDPTSTTND